MVVVTKPNSYRDQENEISGFVPPGQKTTIIFLKSLFQTALLAQHSCDTSLLR